MRAGLIAFIFSRVVRTVLKSTARLPLGLKLLALLVLACNVTPAATLGVELVVSTSGGLVVSRILPSSPANSAGLLIGDVLTAFNGAPIRSPEQLQSMLSQLSQTSSASIELLRSGQRRVLQVQFGASPTNPPSHNTRSSETLVETSLKKQTVIDALGTGGPAATLLVPAGWQLDARVLWRPLPSDPATFQIVARSQDGSSEIGILPNLVFAWNPMLAQMGLPGNVFLGAEIKPPTMDAAEAVQNLVIPRFQPALRGARMIGGEPLPGLAAAAARKNPDAQAFRPSFAATRTRFEYVSSGITYEEDLYLVLTSVQIPTAGMSVTYWSVDQAFYSRAKKGALEHQQGLMEAMIFSFKPTLQWYNRYSQVSQMLVQDQIQQSNRAVELSRFLARTSEQITASVRSAYQNRQQALDRVNAQWDQHIRDVDEYRAGNGESMSLPSGYEKAWTNATGDVVLSNSVSFNPNAGSSLDWRQMDKVR